MLSLPQPGHEAACTEVEGETRGRYCRLASVEWRPVAKFTFADRPPRSPLVQLWPGCPTCLFQARARCHVHRGYPASMQRSLLHAASPARPAQQPDLASGAALSGNLRGPGSRCARILPTRHNDHRTVVMMASGADACSREQPSGLRRRATIKQSALDMTDVEPVGAQEGPPEGWAKAGGSQWAGRLISGEPGALASVEANYFTSASWGVSGHASMRLTATVTLRCAIQPEHRSCSPPSIKQSCCNSKSHFRIALASPTANPFALSAID